MKPRTLVNRRSGERFEVPGLEHASTPSFAHDASRIGLGDFGLSSDGQLLAFAATSSVGACGCSKPAKARSDERLDWLESVTIAVTSACNLRCSYCYQDRSRPGRVEESTVRRVAELLCGSRRHALELWFTGGEPLLGWPLVRPPSRRYLRRPRRAARGSPAARPGMVRGPGRDGVERG